ncbi:Retrovirus-related Pol polyprotein from transposon 17.6, partial [Nosema granulosis]
GSEHYEFNRMPFGLCNAPATFQRAMNAILKQELGVCAMAYLDDIIIFSPNRKLHLEHIRTVLNRLRDSNIILNRKKCNFMAEEVKILGNIISEGTVKPDPSKVECIKKYPLPRTIRELRSFLGVINYCRDFIPNFAEMASSLYDLLKGETRRSFKTISHNEKTVGAFKMLRSSLSEETSRAQPDFSKGFILTTDASEIGIGAILAQADSDGKEKMISAFSKNFDKHQLNYSVTDKELLAVVKSIEHYRHYLLGKEFILRTDHKALTYLWESNNPTSRLLRWAMKLQEYKFRIDYIKGEDNAADGYSRINTLRYRSRPEDLLQADQKRRILEDYHISLGHGSPNNMKATIPKRYKWPNIYKDIENFCAECDICKRAGKQVVNTKNKCIETSRTNELWEIDLVGRLNDRGTNKFIVVCIDHYSKWVETKVILQKTAGEIARAVEELIIARHGVPERILSDCGLEFNN